MFLCQTNITDSLANNRTDIGVDGGVGPSTAGDCCSAGANMLVAGTSLTRSEDPISVVKQLRNIAAQRQV